MQVLFALLALALVGLFTYNVKRHNARTEEGMIWNEVEGLALASAQDALDRAGTLPYDARGNVTAPAGFTDSTAFGGRAYNAAADLDDLDGATRRDTVTTAEGALLLESAMDVRYVTLSGGAYAFSPAKTYTKELVVTVTGPGGALVRLSRVYAYRPT